MQLQMNGHNYVTIIAVQTQDIAALPEMVLITASGKPPRILRVARKWQCLAFGIAPYLLYDVFIDALSYFGAHLTNGSIDVNFAK